MSKIFSNKSIKNIDWVIVGCILALVIIGLLCIINATADPIVEGATFSEKLESIDFSTALRQFIWFLVGCAAMIVMLLVDLNAIRERTVWIYAINIGLLVMLFGLAAVTRNTISWYRIGNVGFQPSELCKISLSLMLAKNLSALSPSEPLDSFGQTIKPIFITAIAFGLVVIQGDMGTATVFLFILAGMLIAARISWKIVLGYGGVIIALIPIAWLLMNDIRRDRIRVFFNPELDTSGAGYNVKLSKIAIGSGQVTGKGMLSDGGLSQLNWVPEKETDFIFSVAAETFGFIGGLVIILIYFVLIFRTLQIAMKSKNRFGSFYCVGIASMMIFHVFENIGMSMGLMPVTGIPLPFMSYGGSNMLTNMLAYGLVLNVGAHAHRT